MPKSKSQPFKLPDAANLLGTLLHSLKVPLPTRRRESVRKYLRGARPLGEGMLDAVIQSVVKAGYIPNVGIGADGIEPTALVTHSLAHAVVSWDRFVGHVSPLLVDADGKTTATRCLRLAALDFAIRAAAFDVLSGVSDPSACLDDREADVPSWARDGGLRGMLRALPRSLGTTRAKLSPTKRFDDMLDGRGRPSLTKISQFAARVAKHDKGRTSTEALQLRLLWAFALDVVCNQIAKVVGRDVVEDIARAFRRVRSNARQIVLADELRTSEDYRKRVSVLCGIL